MELAESDLKNKVFVQQETDTHELLTLDQMNQTAFFEIKKYYTDSIKNDSHE